MGVEAALQQMIVLFFGILLGFAASKLKILNEGGSKAITKLVMNITLPLFIISSGFSSNSSVEGLDMLFYFLLALACYAIAYLIGLAITRLPLFLKSDRRLYSFMTTFGNTGFIGLPVIGALFGNDAVIYATIFNLPFNFLVFSVGVLLVSDETQDKKVNPRSFINACLVASILAIVIYLVGFQPPTIVGLCFDTIGSATVPLAMIITGASLGKESPKDVFSSPSLYLVCICKVLIVPLLTYALLSLTIDNQMLVNIGTVLMAMPVAANATMLCLQHGGNSRLASRGVFLSTLLSVFTIPILVFLLG